MTNLMTHSLQTGDLTVMSNTTSITVTGHQISCLAAQPAAGEPENSTVHLTFEVKNPQKLPDLLSSAKELGLIFSAEDAANVGLYLVAMGAKHHSPEEMATLQERLSKLMAEIESLSCT